MSEALLIYTKNFLNGTSNEENFVDEFMRRWKIERDDGTSQVEDERLSEILSAIFCIADMFNPNSDREAYEYDEKKLRYEIEKELKIAKFL